MTPRLDHSGRRVAAAARPPRLGDVVIPDLHPTGQARWTVVDIPPAPGPTDVVTLELADAPLPRPRIRRWIYTVRLLNPEGLRS